MTSVRFTLADLNQYMIRTTEWLVDHSSVICLVEYSNDPSVASPKLLRTLKGTPEEIEWPLKKADFDGYFYYGPPARGAVRLLFVGGENELLQAVDLGRSQIESPRLHDVFYGVDRYGNLHLTESSLIDGIRDRLNALPSPPVARRRDSTHFDRSGIEAPASFPFECGDETFVLVVDFTVARRDHYLAELQSGDCPERLHAIKELSQLEDPKATAAIEAAAKTKASSVLPSHVFRWSDRRVHSQAEETVRSAAEAALKRIRRSR